MYFTLGNRRWKTLSNSCYCILISLTNFQVVLLLMNGAKFQIQKKIDGQSLF